MRTVVYSSVKSQYLANAIVEGLRKQNVAVESGSIIRKSFGDGENYLKIDIDDRLALSDTRVIYVAATPADADIMELIRLGCGFAGYGSVQRIFVVPFMGYSTMERAVLPGEIVTAKVHARLLSQGIPTSGQGNKFMFLDLHVNGILHYFEGNVACAELYAESVLLEGIKSLQLPAGFMFGSADMGRPKWVETFARKFDTEIALVRKSRTFEHTEVQSVIGDVKGRVVVIYDDMTRSAGTLINAAKAYIEHGATEVYAVLSHLALNGEAIVDKLEASPFKKIVATNSHPMTQCDKVKASDRFIIVDCSSVFVDALARIVKS